MIDEDAERERLDELFDELFPICRSITGPGLRESLDIVKNHMPLEIESVPSGTEVFDWKVPQEWRIHDARLVGPDGNVYADFQETNLSVVNYSEPVDKHLSREELDTHLYTDPEVPEAIPYVTSYYDRTWGFCLSHETYEDLPEGKYHAYIDSEFVDGELNYGHHVLPGESKKEVLLSSYLCHPSLANNELSGPLVLTSLFQRLEKREERRYTYRSSSALKPSEAFRISEHMARNSRNPSLGGWSSLALVVHRTNFGTKPVEGSLHALTRLSETYLNSGVTTSKFEPSRPQGDLTSGSIVPLDSIYRLVNWHEQCMASTMVTIIRLTRRISWVSNPLSIVQIASSVFYGLTSILPRIRIRNRMVSRCSVSEICTGA